MRHASGVSGARGGYTLAELLVSVGLVTVLVGLLVPAVQKAREAAARAGCGNSCGQWGKAALGFEAARGRLPAAGPQPHTGWVADLAPYLGCPANRVPAVPCPAKRPRAAGYVRLDFAAADHLGGGLIDGLSAGVPLTRVTDGLSNTLLAAECWNDGRADVGNFAYPGLPPRGEWYSTAMRTCTTPPRRDGEGPWPRSYWQFGGPHPGSLTCGLGDGSVRAVTYRVDPAVWRALGTRAGGESPGPD
jgi:hypothetical protein